MEIKILFPITFILWKTKQRLPTDQYFRFSPSMIVYKPKIAAEQQLIIIQIEWFYRF
jgi:hypothetical protein